MAPVFWAPGLLRELGGYYLLPGDLCRAYSASVIYSRMFSLFFTD